MWVWDSSTYVATSKNEGGPISTYRWEPTDEDFPAPLPHEASVWQTAARTLTFLILTGLFVYMWWALPV